MSVTWAFPQDNIDQLTTADTPETPTTTVDDQLTVIEKNPPKNKSGLRLHLVKDELISPNSCGGGNGGHRKLRAPLFMEAAVPLEVPGESEFF